MRARTPMKALLMAALVAAAATPAIVNTVQAAQ